MAKTIDQLIKEEDLWELQKEVARLKGQILALTDEVQVRQRAYDELVLLTDQRAKALNEKISSLEQKLSELNKSLGVINAS